MKSCVVVPKILMPPKGTDLTKWSVIACDQYTSQPEYWDEVDKLVGDAPSTLRITLPEVYLENSDVEDMVENINSTMQKYLSDGTLVEMPAGFVLTERYSGETVPRRGLVAAIDLETYEYREGSRSLVRPTEKTVEERIPPRLEIRQSASIELPHIMILIDDPAHSVIDPLFDNLDSFEKIYDTDLMQGGGHINGWFIPEGAQTDELIAKLYGLNEPETFAQKYRLNGEFPLLKFAIGDGNHSMATAKAHWENIKSTLTEDEQRDHPARYCLCEIVNIHDESLFIEPIHRVMFNIDPSELLESARKFFAANGSECSIYSIEETQNMDFSNDMHVIGFEHQGTTGTMAISDPKWGIPLASLQAFLDDYMLSHSQARIDYIHGGEVVKELSSKAGNIGFYLPDIEKEDLFRGVIIDGVLPRKTFSMGEAHEKRYYMESKRIAK